MRGVAQGVKIAGGTGNNGGGALGSNGSASSTASSPLDLSTSQMAVLELEGSTFLYKPNVDEKVLLHEAPSTLLVNVEGDDYPPESISVSLLHFFLYFLQRSRVK